MVRLWQRDAGELLAANRISLLPWVVLLNSTRQQQKEAARRVLATGNRELVARMAELAGLRYGKGVELFERMNEMLITEEILKESSFYRHALEEGLAVGRQEGEISGERKSLRRLLTLKFGSVPDHMDHRIGKADSEALTRWIEQVLTSSSIDEALR